MTYREMEETDIELLIPLYMNYYNGKEDGQWTVQTTYKRIHQVLTREYRKQGKGRGRNADSASNGQ